LDHKAPENEKLAVLAGSFFRSKIKVRIKNKIIVCLCFLLGLRYGNFYIAENRTDKSVPLSSTSCGKRMLMLSVNRQLKKPYYAHHERPKSDSLNHQQHSEPPGPASETHEYRNNDQERPNKSLLRRKLKEFSHSQPKRPKSDALGHQQHSKPPGPASETPEYCNNNDHERPKDTLLRRK